MKKILKTAISSAIALTMVLGSTSCAQLESILGMLQGEQHQHTYSTTWSKDDNNHWHAATCEHTTEVKDKAAHVWGEGVEEDDVVTYTCECGATKTHTHTYSANWSKDETYHWYAATCDHDDKVSGKAEHVWGEGLESGDTITYTCECGATTTHTHTFADEWSKDETYHWYEATCEHDDKVSGKAEHVWGEGVEEGDMITYTCECGATKTHTHTYAEDWKYDATSHWHAATCEHTNKDSGKAAHVLGAAVEVNGQMVRSCECGYEEIEGHTHTYAEAWKYDEINHWHEANCGHDLISEKIAHVWGEGVESGDTITYTCECGATKTHTHTYESDWTYDETNHWHKANCEHSDKVSGTAAHVWDDGVENGDAIVYTCECGATKTHTHTYEEEWTYDENNHWHSASCEHVDKVSGTAAHSYTQQEIEGVMMDVCDCGYSREAVVKEEKVYKFEAECTNLDGKGGPGFSGGADGVAMIINKENVSNGGAVSYLYADGANINFIIHSEEDVDNATLVLGLTCEYVAMTLDSKMFQVRVDNNITEEIIETYDGAWDYNDPMDPEFKGYLITNKPSYTVDYSGISLTPLDSMSEVPDTQEFAVTTTLKLTKGYNLITLMTTNTFPAGVSVGTMGAYAPIVDYMMIITTADLSMKMYDNGYGKPDPLG